MLFVDIFFYDVIYNYDMVHYLLIVYDWYAAKLQHFHLYSLVIIRPSTIQTSRLFLNFYSHLILSVD